MAPTRSTLADWTKLDEDNDYEYLAEKRQRGGRKKRKKTREEEPAEQEWDDIYDPSRPNTYEDYHDSEERVAEIRDWKDRLYAHRTAQLEDSDSDNGHSNYGRLLGYNRWLID